MHPRAGELSKTMINRQSLIDDAKGYETVRALRWPEGVRCPHCDSAEVSKQGRDTTQPARQKYRCTACGRYFDDLTGTVFAGHPQPLRVWVLCWYFLGLNLSNRQIAQELGLNVGDGQAMSEQLRQGVIAAPPERRLSGEVECDEVYVVAGPKGHPEAVLKKGAGDGGAD
jgi:transposase-like protein